MDIEKAEPFKTAEYESPVDILRAKTVPAFKLTAYFFNGEF